MPLFFADLVREFAHAGGAGPLPLEGAVPGHRRFGGVVPAGASFHYAIAGVADPAQWEAGTGALDAQGQLLRTPAASSAGGAAVDFAPGLKTVALTVGASWFAEGQAARDRADAAPLVPELLNGWQNYDPAFADAGYRRDASGRVFLEGMVKAGTAAPYTPIFALPAGYRPARFHLIAAPTDTGPGAVVVTGTAVAYFAGGSGFVSLSGVSFASAA